MSCLWTYLHSRNWPANAKYRFARLLLGLLSALAGLAVWLVIRTRMCSSAEWRILFIGYPAVISWIAVVLYSYRHELPNGKAR